MGVTDSSSDFGTGLLSSYATLAGFEGQAIGTFAPVGTEYVAAVTSAQFVGERWPCLTVEPSASSPDESTAARMSGYPEQVFFQGAGGGARRRPKTVYLSGDGTLEAYKAHWRSWGGGTASADATIEWHGCNPYCAADKPHYAHGEVRLSRAVECHEQLFYNHMSAYVYVHRRLRLLDYSPYNWAPCSE